jgi:hypothetical protein
MVEETKIRIGIEMGKEVVDEVVHVVKAATAA